MRDPAEDTMNDTPLRTMNDPINTNDLVGYRILAKDGPAGRVDETTLETPLSTIVVSTSHLFHRLHQVRARLITSIDRTNRSVTLGLTKRQLRRAPEYHAQESFDSAVVDEQELLAA